MDRLGDFYGLLAPIAATVLFLAITARLIPRSRKQLPLPPGPKPLPILGNVFDVPFLHQWIAFRDLSKKYNSDIVYLCILGTDIILLNSLEVITDLLEKKSSIYSTRNRPRMPMLKELCGFEWVTSLMEYGPNWRKHLKAFHRHFNSTASQQYTKVQTQETRKMMMRLLNSPDDFRAHIKHMTSVTVLRIAYGVDVKESNDPYIAVSERAMEGFQLPAYRGHFSSTFSLPVLKYIPSWLPGAGFKRKAKKWRKAGQAFLSEPFEAAKALKVEDGKPIPIAIQLLQEGEADDSPRKTIELAKQVSGMAYIGASDTTTSSLATFFMAMALYPDVQAKAQAHVDAVIGLDRMPDFQDNESLPYIHEICKEVLRWQPVLPIPVHCVTEDDEYKGYRIPREAVIFPNSWAISYDEKHYADPYTFRPERFLKDGKLDPEVLDPEKPAFGYGRRMCPGRYMAVNSLLLAFMHILACFDIGHAQDVHGNDVPIETNMTPGFLSYPEEFKCSIKPRSKAILGRILRSLEG